MLSVLTSVIALACSASASLEGIRPRGLPSEAVLLVNCGSTTGGMLSLHDYVYYYGSDREARLNTYPAAIGKPTDPGTHDGPIYNIDWHSGTSEHPITADLNNAIKRKFTLHSLNDVGVTKNGEKIKAVAKLDGNDMQCYQENSKIGEFVKDRDQFKCVVNYRCVKKSPTATAQLSLYKSTTTFEGLNLCGDREPAEPYHAFSCFTQWMNGMRDPNTKFDLLNTPDERCSMSFSEENVDINDISVIGDGDVQRFWYNGVAAGIKKHGIALEPNAGCKAYYPSGGFLEVKTPEKTMKYHFSVTCEKKKKCDSTPYMAVLNGVLASAAAVEAPGTINGPVKTSFVDGKGKC